MHSNQYIAMVVYSVHFVWWHIPLKVNHIRHIYSSGYRSRFLLRYSVPNDFATKFMSQRFEVLTRLYQILESFFGYQSAFIGIYNLNRLYPKFFLDHLTPLRPRSLYSNLNGRLRLVYPLVIGCPKTNSSQFIPSLKNPLLYASQLIYVCQY